MDLDTAWKRLDLPFRLGLSQAWLSFIRRGLPVGAVVVYGDKVLSEGRNRVYDPAGGSDLLQRTPLAHAEINALASLPVDEDFARCSIWSTHSPCSMCRSAIGFVGLSAHHYLADDPSEVSRADPVQTSGAKGGIWAVAANVMFLHNVAWVAGPGSPIITQIALLEPEITSLSLQLLDDQSLIREASRRSDLLTGLSGIWERVVSAHGRVAGS